MKLGRKGRSGAMLGADSDSDEEQVELFDSSARGAGGSSRALREHLGHVDEELERLGKDITSLEQVICLIPGRGIERLVNPSNELPPTGSSAVIRIQRSVGRPRRGAGWLDQLRSLPWMQILMLVAVLGVIIGLILLFRML